MGRRTFECVYKSLTVEDKAELLKFKYWNIFLENHRDDVIVIFAGYPDKMKNFLERNEGLRSRIPMFYHMTSLAFIIGWVRHSRMGCGEIRIYETGAQKIFNRLHVKIFCTIKIKKNSLTKIFCRRVFLSRKKILFTLESKDLRQSC